jgi:hypothetical protein
MHRNNHSNVFQDAYLNAHIQFDVQNAVLGEPLETQVLSMLSHVGHTSSDMVRDEVWELLPEDPEIKRLERKRAELKSNEFRVKGSPYEKGIQHLSATISSQDSQAEEDGQRAYRLYYFHNRPTVLGTWSARRMAKRLSRTVSPREASSSPTVPTWPSSLRSTRRPEP